MFGAGTQLSQFYSKTWSTCFRSLNRANNDQGIFLRTVVGQCSWVYYSGIYLILGVVPLELWSSIGKLSLLSDQNTWNVVMWLNSSIAQNICSMNRNLNTPVSAPKALTSRSQEAQLYTWVPADRMVWGRPLTYLSCMLSLSCGSSRGAASRSDTNTPLHM